MAENVTPGAGESHNDHEISNVTDINDNESETETIQNIDDEKKEINNNDDENRKDNDKKNQTNINSPLFTTAVVVCIIGIALYWIYFSDIDSSEIEYYTCPHSPVYIPANGKRFEIDAFSENSVDSPSNVECQWKYDRAKKPKNLLVTHRETCKLKLQNTISTGQFDINLIVKSKNERMPCSIKLILYSVPYFGIDLGTTYSSISYQKTETNQNGKRKCEIVRLGENRYSFPTAIYIPPNDHQSLKFGQNALNMRHKYPQNVIYDIKRIVGRRASDDIKKIKKFNDTHSFIVDVDHNNNVIVKVPKFVYNNTKYIKYYPEETLSPILAHLVHTASKIFNVPYIADIVISVPAYFNNHQRKGIINACKIAGLNPLQLVVEPTAAALSHAYYSLLPQNAFDLFMVFDYGGGTLDCSILQCYGEQTCEVFYVGGDSLLGGIDYDHVIVDIMKRKFKEEYGWNQGHFTPEMNAQFLLEAEKVKLQLTEHDSKPIWMSNGIKNKSIVITRNEFENDEKTQKLLKRAIEAAKNTIKHDPDHTEGNIKMILMVGGTSQIPIVRSKLQDAFGEIPIPEPDKECELTVVKGTCVIGGELAFGKGGVQRSQSKRNTIDVIPFPLGFKICDGLLGQRGVTCDNMDIVVKRGQKYPYQTSKVYRPYDPDAIMVDLELYEGNNPKTSDNFFVSKVTINGFTKDIRLCDIIFQIDDNGIVEINATVRGKENDIFVMKPLSVLSDDRGLKNKDIVKLKRKMAKYDVFPSEIQTLFSQ